MIVPIGMASAQAVVASTKEIPVVFSAITDPISAKLVPSWQPSGTNVTGLSNQQDIAPEVALIKEIVPNVKAIGYVYSPGEVNSVAMLKELKAEAEKQGLMVVKAPAQVTADVLNAARSLKDKVQVIYTGHDNNVVASYSSMYKVAVEMKIPWIASDGNSVNKGVVAAMGVNYVDLGKDTGKMVAQILRGEATGKIAPQKPAKLELLVSKKHASEQGITLPETVLQRAAKVVE
ncbi:ABC transporter substrate-binding protein [Neisseriaceae bacterium B1]